MMDDKSILGWSSYSSNSSLPMIRRPHTRATHRALLVFLLTACLGSLILLHFGLITSPMSMIWLGSGQAQGTFESDNAPLLYGENVTRIPLEAHIMSKCPDARDCLRDFVVPAMEKVVDKVDFRLSFIGR